MGQELPDLSVPNIAPSYVKGIVSAVANANAEQGIKRQDSIGGCRRGTDRLLRIGKRIAAIVVAVLLGAFACGCSGYGLCRGLHLLHPEHSIKARQPRANLRAITPGRFTRRT